MTTVSRTVLEFAAFGAEAATAADKKVRQGVSETARVAKQAASQVDAWLQANMKAIGAVALGFGAAATLILLKTPEVNASLSLIRLGLSLMAMEIGGQLAPAFDAAGSWTLKLADWFSRLAPPVQGAIGVFIILTAVLGTLAVVGGVAFMALAGAAAATGLGLGLLLVTMGLVIGALLAVAAVVALLYLAWESNFLGIRDLVAAVWGAVTSATETVVGFLKGAFQAVVGALEAAGGAFWAFLAAAGGAITQAWGVVRGALDSIGAALIGVAQVPVSILLGALDILLATVGAVFGSMVAIVAGVFASIKALFTGDFASLQDIWGSVLDTLADLWSGVWDTIVDVFSDVWTRISSIYSTAWANIVSAFSDVWARISSVFTAAWATLKAAFQTAWDFVIGLFNWENIVSGLKTAWEGIGTFVGGLWTKIRSGFDTLWSNLTTWAGQLGDTIIGIFQAMFKPSSWLPARLEWQQTFDVLGVQRSVGFSVPFGDSFRAVGLAQGGIVMPTPGGTLARIAEAGQPEVVLPLDKLGAVMRQHAPAAIPHAGGPAVVLNVEPGAVVIHGSGAGGTAMDLERAFDHLARRLEAQFRGRAR